MNKTELLNKFSKDPEERIILARALDQLDRAQNRSIPCATQFLSPAQRAALEPLLAAYPFFRCHKSYLVNLAFIQGIDRERMVFQMREGGSAYIRRETFYRARSAWENWLFSAARREEDGNG